MSNPQDISVWMKTIQESVWDSLGKSSKGIMNTWAYFITMRMKSAKQSYPSAKPIGIKSGALAKAIQSGTDDGIMDDNVIVYERTIPIKYGAISEYGKQEHITKKQMGKFYALYKESKETKYLAMYLAARSGKIFNHRPFEFIKDSIKEFDIEKISPIVEHFVNSGLSKIPNLEVTIGNK